MIKKIITSTDQPEFVDFWNLCDYSFPTNEKRNIKQQKRSFKTSNYLLEAFYENDVFIGFLSFWLYEKYVYVEHFAINPELRGQGYGSKVLKELLDRFDRLVIIEIEPVTGKMTGKRLHFYLSLDFQVNDFEYYVQAYQDHKILYKLLVLSHPRKMSQEELDAFKLDFVNVML